MPCPHRDRQGDGDDASGENAGGPGRLVRGHVERRSFLKSALAIGGTGALSACVSRGADVPSAPSDTDRSFPERQHAWNAVLPRDPHGNVSLPAHQLLVFADYAGTGTPRAAERERVATALRRLEHAFPRGNGGSDDRPDGLLFTVGYSRQYFDRFDPSAPVGVDLPRPERTLRTLGQDPSLADPHDVVFVMNSDNVSTLLSAEAALFDGLSSVSGVDVPGLNGVLTRTERRTGFVGPGLVSDRLEADVPDNAPQAMGYKSGLRGNQATEDRVTIETGAFADGTTQHVSRLTMALDRWYEETGDERVRRMFADSHDPAEVGDTGEFLAGDSGITPEVVSDGRGSEQAGHAQKLARARDDAFEPRVLRRSEGVSTDLSVPGMNFTAVQREFEAIVDVLDAMYGGGDPTADGITSYLETRARGNYLIPPRRHRALPAADP